jgi:glycine hydroxymethyltransferase
MRVGTAAITTRGMNEEDMDGVVELIDKVLMNIDKEESVRDAKQRVNDWMKSFPLYAKEGEEIS